MVQCKLNRKLFMVCVYGSFLSKKDQMWSLRRAKRTTTYSAIRFGHNFIYSRLASLTNKFLLKKSTSCSEARDILQMQTGCGGNRTRYIKKEDGDRLAERNFSSRIMDDCLMALIKIFQERTMTRFIKPKSPASGNTVLKFRRASMKSVFILRN